MDVSAGIMVLYFWYLCIKIGVFKMQNLVVHVNVLFSKITQSVVKKYNSLHVAREGKKYAAIWDSLHM